jgi:hypothetical protein
MYQPTFAINGLLQYSLILPIIYSISKLATTYCKIVGVFNKIKEKNCVSNFVHTLRFLNNLHLVCSNSNNTVVSNHVNSDHVPSFSCLDV